MVRSLCWILALCTFCVTLFFRAGDAHGNPLPQVTLPRQLPQVTLPAQPRPVVTPTVKVCPCSPACECGCNEGRPCDCAERARRTTYQPVHQPVYYSVPSNPYLRRSQSAFSVRSNCGLGG